MSTPCIQNHKYVIATIDGSISPIFYSVEEAEGYKRDLPILLRPFWVAFHEVAIQELVDHPDSIKSYCGTETSRVENPRPTVDFTKRS